MNCEEIKDIIVTDYLDREVNEEMSRCIESHISKCSNCYQFENMLKLKVVDPFKSMKVSAPPDSVWINIKDNIKHGQRVNDESGILDVLLHKARILFSIKRPVFAVLMLMVVITVGTLFIKTKLNNDTESDSFIREYLNEHVEFLTELDLYGDDYMEMNNFYFHTSIENYLF